MFSRASPIASMSCAQAHTVRQHYACDSAAPVIRLEVYTRIPAPLLLLTADALGNLHSGLQQRHPCQH